MCTHTEKATFLCKDNKCKALLYIKYESDIKNKNMLKSQNILKNQEHIKMKTTLMKDNIKNEDDLYKIPCLGATSWMFCVKYPPNQGNFTVLLIWGKYVVFPVFCLLSQLNLSYFELYS